MDPLLCFITVLRLFIFYCNVYLKRWSRTDILGSARQILQKPSVTSKDSDNPAHQPSMARDLFIPLWIALSYRRHMEKKLWENRENSDRTYCRFCRALAHLLRLSCIRINFTPPLRKHAYSSILKILPPKNENFQIKKIWYSPYFCSNNRLWVLVRTASARRF